MNPARNFVLGQRSKQGIFNGVNILAIDTSTKYLSIGIVIDGQAVFVKDIYAHLKTASIIIPTINKILKKLKISLDDFDCFAIGLGPGSFTGLRIGVSTIKAFSFCKDKKIIGIPSLDIIALNVNADGNICVFCDARRNLLYVGFYKSKDGVILRHGPIKLSDINSAISRGTARRAPTTYFLGDGVGVYRDKINCMGTISCAHNVLDEAFWYPKAENLCKIAIEKFKKQQFINLDKLKPLYLYPKDCQIRK